MNILVTTVAVIVLTLNLATDKANGKANKATTLSAAKKHLPLDKSAKPKASTPIPSTMVGEAQVAEVIASNGDTIRYKPYLVPRKIKH